MGKRGTKTIVLEFLQENGDADTEEISRLTGEPYSAVRLALRRLSYQKVVENINPGKNRNQVAVYRLI